MQYVCARTFEQWICHSSILKVSLAGKNLILDTAYKPPKVSFCDFEESMEVLMSHLQSFNSETSLIGDFNIEILWTSDTVRNYQNLVPSFGFSVWNTDPTRVSATSSSCFDHINSNAKLIVQNVCCAISDHFGLAVEWSNYLPYDKFTREILYRDFKAPEPSDNLLKFIYLLFQKILWYDDTRSLDQRFSFYSFKNYFMPGQDCFYHKHYSKSKKMD